MGKLLSTVTFEALNVSFSVQDDEADAQLNQEQAAIQNDLGQVDKATESVELLLSYRDNLVNHRDFYASAENLSLAKVAMKNVLWQAGCSRAACESLVPISTSYSVEGMLADTKRYITEAIKALIKMIMDLVRRIKDYLSNLFGRKKQTEQKIKKLETVVTEMKKEGVSEVKAEVTVPNESNSFYMILATGLEKSVQHLIDLEKGFNGVKDELTENLATIKHIVAQIDKGVLAETIPAPIAFQSEMGNVSKVRRGRLPTSEATMGVIPDLPFGHEFVYNLPTNNPPMASDLHHYRITIRPNESELEQGKRAASDIAQSGIQIPISQLELLLKHLQDMTTHCDFAKLSPLSVQEEILRKASHIDLGNDFDRRAKMTLNALRGGATYLANEYFQWVNYYNGISNEMTKVISKVINHQTK